MDVDLHWLPFHENWPAALSSLNEASPKEVWARLVQLANHRLDFICVAQLDARLRKIPCGALEAAATKSVRLAVLGSATTAHLLPSLRVAALRRGCLLTTYSGAYGQYRQELIQRGSRLHEFSPEVLLLSLDARHVLGLCDGTAGEGAVRTVVEQLAEIWRMAHDAFGGQIIQQAVAPIHPPLLGGNEHRLRDSASWRINVFNQMLRARADELGVDILALDAAMIRHGGVTSWHDPRLWHHAKQEIRPAAAPLYADLAMRLIAARRGWSFKCLVLDLDNTLWGGVVGEQGLEGIALGQNDAEGEAFIAFQSYVAALARRGVILAVCSKNDETMALLPFERHPDMVIRRSDVAAFLASWDDKPRNIREIAQRINIGLDALVFVDDSPFERGAVRRELPMVAVPELPDDPARYADCLADSGYFESISVTAEDLRRSDLYSANVKREELRATATSLHDYLRSLDMELAARPFSETDSSRIVQLINKTNQFNLTTWRCTDAEVAKLVSARNAIAMQFRLRDRFGDNGIIAIIIAEKNDDIRADASSIVTWLMSCRVLGRQVEEACLNALVEAATRRGIKFLHGLYIESERNQMVKDHYARLGFKPLGPDRDGRSEWMLELSEFRPFATPIALTGG
jgi:FkbH-like protein